MQLNCSIANASPGWRRARISGIRAGKELEWLHTRASGKSQDKGAFSPSVGGPHVEKVFVKTPSENGAALATCVEHLGAELVSAMLMGDLPFALFL